MACNANFFYQHNIFYVFFYFTLESIVILILYLKYLEIEKPTLNKVSLAFKDIYKEISWGISIYLTKFPSILRVEPNSAISITDRKRKSAENSTFTWFKHKLAIHSFHKGLNIHQDLTFLWVFIDNNSWSVPNCGSILNGFTSKRDFDACLPFRIISWLSRSHWRLYWRSLSNHRSSATVWTVQSP
jgi:hypothetical protein